ncbi:response regulator [Dehalobacter sp. DCM]|uniref:HD domain-containing phosphohydrolase n=1 Tax=Dehalobacter sp. DCM TaxID=2907827 RepID=UPI003081DD7E|nr:response regulator [Dehalobacter sp. DCM]
MEATLKGSKIVIADDDPVSLKSLKMHLIKLGYSVFAAKNGIDALDLIQKAKPDLVILDINMPGLSGLEVSKVIRESDQGRFLPILVLTGSKDKKDRTRALKVGINDFLVKPFDALELKLKIGYIVGLKHAIDDLKNVNNILLALAKAVDAKDHYTEGHTERVSQYAVKIAENMNLSTRQIRDLTTASILHDIGKIGIPDNILNKNGKLTDQEYALMKKHPVIGEQICSSIKAFHNVNRIIRQHHEKLDGSGYPDGISGDAINIETRILTVADIYDALTSDRPYRPAMSKEKALEILTFASKNGELDSLIVNELIRTLPEISYEQISNVLKEEEHHIWI